MEEAPDQREWFCSSCVVSNASKKSDAVRNTFPQVAVEARPKRKAAIESMDKVKAIIRGDVEDVASSNKSKRKMGSSAKW
jgi:hypothetical protein